MTLLELFQLLKKHLKLVITLPVVCAIAMGIVSFVAMDNTYTATTSMYILAKTDDSGQMSYNDLSASQMLSNDIATLLDSDSVKTTTRVITLSVTGTDAKETAEVAKAIASSVSTVAQNVGAAQSINVIDEAKTPEAPSGPKRTLYIAVAFLAGIFIAVAYVVLADMLNTRIRGAEEAEELLGIPVVGRIPAMKGGK